MGEGFHAGLTDGHKAYLDAFEDAIGADIDYAQLQKINGAPSDEEVRRISTVAARSAEPSVWKHLRAAAGQGLVTRGGSLVNTQNVERYSHLHFFSQMQSKQYASFWDEK
jgi:hypothetical protein